MRKNTREVFNAWKQGKRKKFCDAIHTDFGEIYSYATLLVAQHDNTVVLNRTKYSITTSIHQGGLHVLLEKHCKDNNLELLIVEDIPIGYRSCEAIEIAVVNHWKNRHNTQEA